MGLIFWPDKRALPRALHFSRLGIFSTKDCNSLNTFANGLGLGLGLTFMVVVYICIIIRSIHVYTG